MVKREKMKKTDIKFNGVSLSQAMKDNKFVKEYAEWESFCRGVSGESLYVKNIPSLYDMLANHITEETTRQDSVNRKTGKIGDGGTRLMAEISRIMGGDSFTVGEIEKIKQLADDLEAMEDTTLDPALIRFTEQKYTRRGKKKGDPVIVTGHYRTPSYVERRNRGNNKDPMGAAPPSFFTGQNPPHQALFSEGASEFAKPRGLLGILKDAEENLSNMRLEDIQITPNLSDSRIGELNNVSVIRDFFDGVVNTQGFWRKGQGKLMPSNVQREISAFDFAGLKPKDEQLIRTIANLGSRKDKASIAGSVDSFTLKLSVGAVVKLVDAALKRKGTEAGYYRAPDGFIAWQSAIANGFDYRKTRKEVNPEKFRDVNTREATSKVISKSWRGVIKNGY